MFLVTILMTLPPLRMIWLPHGSTWRFVDITDSRPLPGMEWTLVTDRDAASRHGVSIAGLGTMIKMLTRGVRISDYRPDDSAMN